MFILKCADLAEESQEAKCDFVANGETKEEVMKTMMEGKSEEEMAKMKEDMMAKITEE